MTPLAPLHPRGSIEVDRCIYSNFEIVSSNPMGPIMHSTALPCKIARMPGSLESLATRLNVNCDLGMAAEKHANLLLKVAYVCSDAHLDRSRHETQRKILIQAGARAKML